MPTWRKILFIAILLTLVVVTIVFWGELISCVCVVCMILSFQAFLFNRYASSELAKTFQEDGKNVKGWRD